MLVQNHMKSSINHAIDEGEGYPPDRAIKLDQFGHSQSADQILALDLARKDRRFRKGPVIMAAAGSGYVWGSTVVRWG